MEKNSASGSSIRKNSTTGHHKIWITEKYYLLVDNDGHTFTEDTFEGALGYVLRLHKHDNSGIYQALKIPKLVGATLRENAYIVDLMREEIRNVEIVTQRGLKAGVIHDFAINPLRGRLNLENSDDEDARKHNDGIIIFSCTAGSRPRFLIVNQKGEIYPKQQQNLPAFGKAFFSRVEEKAQRSGTSWKQSVYIIAKPQDSEERAEDLTNGSATKGNTIDSWEIINNDEAEKSSVQGETWYAGAPSIIYNWAAGTLQKAVSKFDEGGRGSWSPQQHVMLAKTICEGLITLHSKGVIHADNRPANIMYIDDPQDPKNYVIVDFGSLVSATAFKGMSDRTGHTLVSGTLRTEHVSVFYAPERYQGTERESAERARVIKNDKDQQRIFLVLGWQDDGELDNLTYEDLENHREGEWLDNSDTADNQLSSGDSENIDDTILDSGDRVQVQDYIFELDGQEFRRNRLHIFPCKPTLSRLVHSRIVIRDDRNNYPDYIAVDRVIETKQWTAATDIFSLGVLLLFSIFHRVPYDPEKAYELYRGRKLDIGIGDEEKTDSGPAFQPGSAQISPLTMEVLPELELIQENDKEAENHFQEMLKYLTSVSTFQTLWPDLESIRMELERNLEFDRHLGPQPIAARPFPLEKYNQRQFDDTGSPDMYKQTVEVIKRITQNVPHTRRIAAALDFDLVAFVFIIHFAMACLHRQSHLKVKESWMSENMPFCKDRREQTMNRAAERAMVQLEKIHRFLGDGRFDEFRIGYKSYEDIERDVPVFRPRPQSDLINENFDLKTKLGKTEDDLKKLKDTIAAVATAGEHLESALANPVQRFFSPNAAHEALSIIRGVMMKLEEARENNDGS